MNQPDAPPPSEPDKEDGEGSRGTVDRSWTKFVGLGMELAGSVLGLLAIGYWIDRARGGDGVYGIAAGASIGFTLGMFRFIQKALRATHNQSN